MADLLQPVGQRRGVALQVEQRGVHLADGGSHVHLPVLNARLPPVQALHALSQNTGGLRAQSLDLGGDEVKDTIRDQRIPVSAGLAVVTGAQRRLRLLFLLRLGLTLRPRVIVVRAVEGIVQAVTDQPRVGADAVQWRHGVLELKFILRGLPVLFLCILQSPECLVHGDVSDVIHQEGGRDQPRALHHLFLCLVGILREPLQDVC
mmetsp:Transcript_134441/g.374704  ORF Transcript_134441/g.374704 Transcript_134441/m.374704 type:complete len:205 (-) Transcript_134441:565-1179(-)